MDRNIMTTQDVIARQRPESEAADEATARVVPTQADSYFDRLAKYVPVEIIGAYLLIEGLVKELTEGAAEGWALLVLLLLGLAATWLFAQRVLHVVRTTQRVMSVLAFAVWVFATGGWFATLSFWAPGWGTVAVIAFGVAVRIVQLEPLPQEPPPTPS
mgnify:CR=1 FL=1